MFNEWFSTIRTFKCPLLYVIPEVKYELDLQIDHKCCCTNVDTHHILGVRKILFFLKVKHDYGLQTFMS